MFVLFVFNILCFILFERRVSSSSIYSYVADAAGTVHVHFVRRVDAVRALGRLMVAAHNAPFGSRPGAQAALAAGMQFEETPWLETMGVQLDCSRGGVPHVDALQERTVQLALYGYNALLLYMEDVYEVPGAVLSCIKFACFK